MERKPRIKRVGAPAWVVTFTDLTSLLTTFFVLLITFSTMVPQEDSQAPNAQTGSPGLFGETISSLQNWMQAPHDPSRQDTEGQENPPDPRLAVRPGELKLPDGRTIAEGELAKGCRIGPILDRYFRPGESQPCPRLREFLAGVARALRVRPGLLVLVEGFADAGESADALALSYERAWAAARLLQEGGLAPGQIAGLRGMGAGLPADPGDPDPLAADRNRRLELWVQGR